jgi:Tol biopolymer transport system component
MANARKEVVHLTTKIETNPKDAYNYYLRAQCHDYLGDRASANADMRRWSAVAGGRQASDLQFGTPVNLGPTVNTGYPDIDSSISSDGLSLYFNSTRPGGYGGWDLWVAKRATENDPWGEPQNCGSAVNTAFGEASPCISADGLSLFFSSGRPGVLDKSDIWVATRETKDSAWDPPQNLGPPVNSLYGDGGPEISTNGLELYFSSPRPDGFGNGDIWVSTRATTDDPWSEPVNLGPHVNGSSGDSGPSLSGDGLMLFFKSNRPGGFGAYDLYMTRRTSVSDAWGMAVNLGPNVNSPAGEELPCVAADGTLYFSSNRPGGYGNFDMWQVKITSSSEVFQEGSYDELDQITKQSNKRLLQNE